VTGQPVEAPSAEVDMQGIEPNTFPLDLVEHGARWLVWQYSDDRKVPRNPTWGCRHPGNRLRVRRAKNPDAWFDFETARDWVAHDDDLGLAYYLATPDRDDWDTGEGNHCLVTHPCWVEKDDLITGIYKRLNSFVNTCLATGVTIMFSEEHESPSERSFALISS
jgi:hypothetical protein